MLSTATRHTQIASKSDIIRSIRSDTINSDIKSASEYISSMCTTELYVCYWPQADESTECIWQWVSDQVV